MTEQEKLMYEILGQITTSDIPDVYKRQVLNWIGEFIRENEAELAAK